MTPELLDASRRAVQVLRADGGRLAGGRAVLFTLAEIGWHPRLAGLAAHRPFVWGAELGYRVVAANRARLARWTAGDDA